MNGRFDPLPSLGSREQIGNRPVQSINENRPLEGHQYGNVVVNDSAIVIQGDNAVIHHHGRDTQDDQQNMLLLSLPFDNMGARLRNVASAMPTTCEWLFLHPQFRTWIDKSKAGDHHGFLWIKGKPGSGKSTIMKTALAHAQKWRSELTVSYFFNARSPSALEKSPLGLYRALIHQILRARPTLLSTFVETFWSKVTISKEYDKDGREIIRPSVEPWTVVELRNFLHLAISEGLLPAVNIFIDALDEGNDDEVRELVEALEDSAASAVSAQIPLRICLSSRHYPHISISTGLQIIVEQEPSHSQDIRTYLQTKIKNGPCLQVKTIQDEIFSKSEGVFLWVVLVVRVLNKAKDRGEDFESLLRLLQELPADLHALFDSLLDWKADDAAQCAALLRWVLYAGRPLEPYELFNALTWRTRGFTPKYARGMIVMVEPNPEMIILFLINRSRGLVELTSIDLRPVVQFIHETVRDYLQDTFRNASHSVTAQRDGPNIPDFGPIHCHSLISEECLDFLVHNHESRKIDAAHLLQEGLRTSVLLTSSGLEHLGLANYILNYAPYHAHFGDKAKTWMSNNIPKLKEKTQPCGDLLCVVLCLLSARFALISLSEDLRDYDFSWLLLAILVGNNKLVEAFIHGEYYQPEFVTDISQALCAAVSLDNRDIVNILLHADHGSYFKFNHNHNLNPICKAMLLSRPHFVRDIIYSTWKIFHRYCISTFPPDSLEATKTNMAYSTQYLGDLMAGLRSLMNDDPEDFCKALEVHLSTIASRYGLNSLDIYWTRRPVVWPVQSYQRILRYCYQFQKMLRELSPATFTEFITELLQPEDIAEKAYDKFWPEPLHPYNLGKSISELA